MPDEEPASTATLEPEVKEEAPQEEPQVEADFKEPKEEPEPAVIEVADEKSASDRYVDELMSLPVDERTPLLSKLEKRMEEAGDAVPWKERQEQADTARTNAASQLQERERRAEELKSWKSNSDAARANVNWIVNDLSEKWEKRGVDDPAPRHDSAELDRQLAELTKAEAGLLSHKAITEVGNGLAEGIQEHGGPITAEEMASVTTGTRADMVKGYMGVLAKRVREETSMELNKEITKRIEDAVLAETAAIKAEAMREVQVAPEQVQTQAAGPQAPTASEYSAATSEQRAEWKKDGIDPVPNPE